MLPLSYFPLEARQNFTMRAGRTNCSQSSPTIPWRFTSRGPRHGNDRGIRALRRRTIRFVNRSGGLKRRALRQVLSGANVSPNSPPQRAKERQPRRASQDEAYRARRRTQPTDCCLMSPTTKSMFSFLLRSLNRKKISNEVACTLREGRFSIFRRRNVDRVQVQRQAS